MKKTRGQLLLFGVIIAAFIGALLLIVPGSPFEKKPTLGLDLQGGLEVVLKAVPPKGHKLTSADLNRAKDIMETRINKIGVASPDVRVQQPDQIVIQLAGVKDPEAASRLIGKTAQLEFYDFEQDVTGPSRGVSGNPVAATSPYDLLKQVQDKVRQEGVQNANGFYLFRNVAAVKAAPVVKKNGKLVKPAVAAQPPRHILVAGPLPTRAELLRPTAGKLPPGGEVLGVPSGMTFITCPASAGCVGSQVAAPNYYYLFKYNPGSKNGPPEMTGKDLNLSGTQADIDPTTGSPIVSMQFTSHGASVFHQITRAEAQRGQTAANLAGKGGDHAAVTTYAGHFAIVLDGVIRSSPYIDYIQNPDGIAGSQAQITLGQGGSNKQAKDLALVLQTGALPVNFRQVERTVVSATLGKDSLRQAWEAAVIGLLLVAVFLLLLYRFLGLIAVFGLAIYSVFYFAAILIFGVTLTLPGFAGLILTIGVAADANVVIFERIKEEVRSGKSVRAAISAGYGKGFHTIVDANVVTAITALILFAVATADVKGFALMLLIGTIISLVTAVAATRAMLSLLAGFKWFSNARLMGAQGKQKGRWLQIDFMKRRYLWFAISGVIVLVSGFSLLTKGLNLGIDFKGGTQVTFTAPQPVPLAKIRGEATAIGQRDAVVQGRGKVLAGSDSYKQFQLRMKSLSSSAQTNLAQDLKAKFNVSNISTKNVSSSFGSQIANAAILAILVSLFLIVLYIAFRFDFKYALPVIVAMIHDVLICVGVYSLVGKEVTAATVAAILTVLGYSIYDTIIIFDRIRENVPIMRKQPFAAIANVSLWETIRRSLATTFITLLPIGALEVLGGATLKDFAFALMVGVTAGAYSSIFIAAPLLTILKEREPDFRRRKTMAAKVDLDGPDGDLALKESEDALAAEPTPTLDDIAQATPSTAKAISERERREARERRQQNRRRKHGRPR